MSRSCRRVRGCAAPTALHLHPVRGFGLSPTTQCTQHDGRHPPATPTRPPPHPPHLHSRIRRHTPPRRARIRALPSREEGLGCTRIARSRRVVRFRLIVFVLELFIALSWILLAFAGGGRGSGAGACTDYYYPLQFIGNRAWRRSSTRCSSSP
jgi:hypothetical protein